MGGKVSLPDYIKPEVLDEYVELTYLSRNEIINLLNDFQKFGERELKYDFNFRFPVEKIINQYPALKYNPFCDRIIRVFSSYKDDCFSFEDTLDLCSVMSENCPSTVKAKWAFKIFDFDGDNVLDEEDLIKTMDRLTLKYTSLRHEDKRHIAKIIMDEMDIQKTKSVGELEFVHGVSKISDFPHMFSFKLI